MYGGYGAGYGAGGNNTVIIEENRGMFGGREEIIINNNRGYGGRQN